MLRHLKWLLCVVASAFGLGGNKPPAANLRTAPNPFAVTENDGIVHEIYRGITFCEFTRTLPGGSIDSIHFDTTIPDYAIALVKVAGIDKESPEEFTTTFFTDQRQTIVKKWTTASGNERDQAQGLFLIPNTVTSVSTTRSPAGPTREGEPARPGENVGDRLRDGSAHGTDQQR